jgi:hypothetical protein
MRLGIEIRTHLEPTRQRALRLEKADQAGVRLRLDELRPSIGYVIGDKLS